MISISGIAFDKIRLIIYNKNKDLYLNFESVKEKVIMIQAEKPPVVVALITKGNTVLMMKRIHKENNIQWVFPGGKIEENESAFDAIIREVAEEIGVLVAPMANLAERIHPDSGVHISYIRCKMIYGTVRNMEKDKASEVAWVPASEVESMVTSNIHPAILAELEKLA